MSLEIGSSVKVRRDVHYGYDNGLAAREGEIGRVEHFDESNDFTVAVYLPRLRYSLMFSPDELEEVTDDARV